MSGRVGWKWRTRRATEGFCKWFKVAAEWNGGRKAICASILSFLTISPYWVVKCHFPLVLFYSGGRHLWHAEMEENDKNQRGSGQLVVKKRVMVCI